MRRLHTFGLLAFCLFSGSRWLLDTAATNEVPTLLTESLHYGVIAAITFTAWLLSPSRVSQSVRGPWFKVSLAGLTLLALPTLLSAWTPGTANAPALFTLAPLLIVVASSSVAGFAGERAKMFPALAGTTGCLLILPLHFPADFRQTTPFLLALAAVALTAVASVWAHRLLQECHLLWAAGVMSASSFLVLSGVAWRAHFTTPSAHALIYEPLRCCLLDLPLLLVFIWLLKKVSPVTLASRFLLVPLTTMLEGFLLLRPHIDLRSAAGLLLTVIGSAMLLFGNVEQERGKTSLLHLS